MARWEFIEEQPKYFWSESPSSDLLVAYDVRHIGSFDGDAPQAEAALHQIVQGYLGQNRDVQKGRQFVVLRIPGGFVVEVAGSNVFGMSTGFYRVRFLMEEVIQWGGGRR